MNGIIFLLLIGLAQCQNFDTLLNEVNKEMEANTSLDIRRERLRTFGFKRNNFPLSRLPPFLRNASEEAKQGFREIFADRSLTFATKKAKIDKLMEKESDVVKAEFERFKKVMEEHREKMEQEHKQAVSKLSKEAQEADAKIMQLFKNESITHNERSQMMREIFENLSEETRNELKTLGPKGRRGQFGRCCKGAEWPIKFGKIVKLDILKELKRMEKNGIRHNVQETTTTTTTEIPINPKLLQTVQ